MKITKHVVTAAATITLAASMTCIAPVAAQAAPAASGDAVVSTTTGSSFAPMATSTTKGTVKANEKRELEFYLKKGSSKKKIKPSKVKWSTGNAKVATVKKGIMTTKKEGKVTITAKYQGHTVLYKITVKGDARFDVTSEAVKGIFKNEAESITENGAQIFRASMTESGTTLVADYNVSKNQFTFSVETKAPNEQAYKVALSFSAKYNKDCTITSYKNDAKVKTLKVTKAAVKVSGNYKLSDVTLDNQMFNAVQSVAIKSFIGADKDIDRIAKYLGFTNAAK